MVNPLVSIIILTYQNGWPHLSECLESLKKVNYKPIEIIVVDNGSIDETVKEVLSVKYKVLNIKMIRNKENVGFAKGNNQAAKLPEVSTYCY